MGETIASEFADLFSISHKKTSSSLTKSASIPAKSHFRSPMLSFKRQTQTFYSDPSDIGQWPSNAIALNGTDYRRRIVEALSLRYAVFDQFRVRPFSSQVLDTYRRHFTAITRR